MPVCVGARAMGGPWRGGGAFMAGAHLLSFSCGPWLARVGGCVCARCSGPQQRGVGALPEAAEGVCGSGDLQLPPAHD